MPLHPEKKDALREEIAAYALEMAGTGVDLDPGLEAVGLAGLKAATERR